MNTPLEPTADDATPLRALILVEEALTAEDAVRLGELHEDRTVSFHVLVPTDQKRNVLADVLDHLSLFELREAVEALRGEPEVTRAEAAQILSDSLQAFGTVASSRVRTSGELVDGDPMTALSAAVSEDRADEVVIVTRPHAVEDTLHTDWASKARERLGVPVLHVYAGSSWLG